MIGMTSRAVKTVALCGLLAVSACSAIYKNHGFAPDDVELQELVVGVDTRATVDDVIGAPSASGLRDGGDYYYVSKRTRAFGPFRPEVVEREVVAISFDRDDTIANIERFGLEDGNVVALSRRVTDSSVAGKGILAQLFENIGNIDPTQFFN